MLVIPPSCGEAGEAASCSWTTDKQLPRGPLIWSDEFSGPLIDDNKWRYENSPPQNAELQTYIGPDVRTSKIVDGHLVISALAQNSIVSARMSTLDSFSFTYGVVEARMRVPSVRGFWPAFWMLGTSLLTEGWPACGEVDIMEVFGKRRGANACSTVHNSMHSWGTRDPLDGGCVPLEEPEPHWHTWKMLWTPRRVAFYADDNETAPYWQYERPVGATGDDFPYTKPMYLIANLAVGGNGPSEPLDWSALDPPGTNLSIDYVRVYALENGFDGYDAAGPAPPPTLPPALLPTAGVVLVVGAAAAAVLLWRRHQRRHMPPALAETLLAQ